MKTRKLLSEFKLNSSYLKWKDELERRETWQEACDRVFDMHKTMFQETLDTNETFKEMFDFSLEAYKNQEILASMRSLQFGGESILSKHGRMFNCLSGYCDRPVFFQECMHWLLCGCGVGFSVQKQHIERMPMIQKRSKHTKTFVIPDTIEGWADAIGVLMSSYFVGEVPFPEYQGRTVHFDFSLIRPSGSYIAGGFKAAGSDGLRKALIKIEELLETEMRNESPMKMRSIIAYDVVMHMSDAVLSGGVRRSATICLFSPEDTTMLKAKTGDWFRLNPQRARSNNSVVLLRDKTTSEQFASIMESVREWGEPAFVWSDSEDIIYNPCVSEDTFVTTKNGIKQVKDLIGKPFEAIVHGKPYNSSKKGFFQTGSKALFKLSSKEGYSVDITSNHKVLLTNGKWVESGDLIKGDKIVVHSHKNNVWSSETTEFDCNEFNTNEIDVTGKSSDYIKNLLCYWFDNEASLENNILKLNSPNLNIAQVLLNSLGVFSVISEDTLSITNESLEIFLNVIGFKMKSYKSTIKDNGFATFESLDYIGIKSVYDCTIEEVHAFDANGLYVHNCVEIGMYPQTESGHSGWQGCVSHDTPMITKEGITTIGKAVDTHSEITIWNGEKWVSVKPFQTGENKELFRVNFSDGSYLDCTENHKFMVKNRFQKEFETVTTSELITTLHTSKYNLHTPTTNVNHFEGLNNHYAYDYGFILGDGCVDKKNIVTEIYDETGKEHILFQSEPMLMRERINENNKQFSVYSFEKLDIDFVSKIKYDSIGIADIFTWNKKSILNFIAGWADADGCNASKGIRIYGTENLMRQLQLLLKKVGLNSSINLMSDVGQHTSELVKSRLTAIWYVQITKTETIPCQRLTCDNPNEASKKGKYQNIKSIEKLEGLHNSYCLEEPETHNCVFGNVLTKQCNLVEINGAKSDTKEKFLAACKAAAIVGTMQAAYTDFKYVGAESKEIFDREALLGTSITGMMNNPDICFNEEIQIEGAELIKKVNKEVAEMIGIRQAARTTCVKPSGNASVTLGCASGIHGEHSPMYFRNVQMNKDDDVAKYFVEQNPQASEDSVWSASNTDWVISFPVVSPEGSIFKSDLEGVRQLEYVKLTQQNWVESGTNVDLCVNSATRHNVSNTISVDNWDEVEEFIYTNRYWLAGVSLLSSSGDRDFAQAPFTAVYTPKEILEMYGDAQMFASGLIVDALYAFDNSLWDACDQILGRGKYNLASTSRHTWTKQGWMAEAEQFANRFFKGDKQKMTYCLKDVYNYHKWVKIQRELEDIDWTQLKVKPDYVNVDTLGAMSCAGGACEIQF